MREHHFVSSDAAQLAVQVTNMINDRKNILLETTTLFVEHT